MDKRIRMKIVVAGGTGQLGLLVTKHLTDRANEVVVLSRTAGPGRIVWDAKTVGDWASVLEKADAVINLCGTPVLKKWTAKNWAEIESSRILSTRAIGHAISMCQSPPKVWINASATGFYGDTGDREVVEATRTGNTRLAQLCKAWEHECLTARTPETRRVCLRIGVVLGPSLQILKIMSLATKMGVCAPLGSGRQFLSWIHWQDFVRMVDWCLSEPVTGAVNATAPSPVTNKEMTDHFRKIYCRPPLPAVPAPIVRLLSAAMGMEPEMLLTGQRAIPEIAVARGFRFNFQDIEPALTDVLETVPTAWRSAQRRPVQR